jgi:hypothetical protein
VKSEKLEEQGGLPHLAWPGEELDPPWGGLCQPLDEQSEAIPVTEEKPICSHSLIIIRL